ncbi:hypothetical protein ACIQTT_01785 [Microbacterium sp. NPDC090225]|uniref:hypothetical protein n=1 Tax=Microbacterium sp. NPDC090225 TaxID=3364207 RepID=UPI0038187A8F
MTSPSVIVEAGGITVQQDEPMTAAEARRIAMRLLEASTGSERLIRRPSTVDEEFREREGGV